MNVGSGKTLTLGGNLTGSGTINSVTIGQSLAAAGSFTTLSASSNVTFSGAAVLSSTLSASGNVSFDGGTFVFNESGADKDFRIEGDTDANLFFTDASTDRVGIGTSSPGAQLQLNKSGTGDYTTFRLSNSGASGKTYEIGVGGNAAAAGYANNLYFYDSTAASLRMTLDSSGNLGLGVTPSGWASTYRAYQVGQAGSLFGLTNDQDRVGVSSNAYFDTTDSRWEYIGTGYAMRYDQNAGEHQWYTAASGAANGAITFTQAMTLDASGNLGVGTTSPSVRLDIQVSTGAATVKVGNNTVSGGALLNLQGTSGAKTWFVGSNYNIGGALEFTQSTANGGSTIGSTPSMVLDASGNLLIGTTTATSALTVEKGVNNATNGLSLVNNNGSDGDGSAVSFYGAFGAPFVTTQLLARINGFVTDPNGAKNGNIAFFTGSSGTVTERARIGSGGEVYFPGVGTTASAANAYLDNGSTPANQLLRSTSSLRYKTDFETLDHAKADAVLNLRPVWYRSKAEADRKDWSWYGLIAEEVAQVEPRLVHWSYPEDQFETIETQTEIEKTREVEVTPAVLDDEGNVVEPAVTETETYTETETKSERKLKADAQLAPDGVQYDRLTVMLLDIVKRQNQRIEQLEAKVAALEAQ
jgi:hypothetical protein